MVSGLGLEFYPNPYPRLVGAERREPNAVFDERAGNTIERVREHIETSPPIMHPAHPRIGRGGAAVGHGGRRRLDSVVTVVDADALLHQLDGNGEEGRMREGRGQDAGSVVGGGGRGGRDGMLVSMKRQLETADVILLNKVDLLDEQGLSRLSAEVARVNPAGRVECCSYGKVPLHSVLDVEAPRTDIQGVSHERVKVHLSVSSKGGNLRTASSSKSSASVPAREKPTGEGHRHGHGHGHLRADGVEQVTFTSSVPLSLARFQDWVCYGMPAGVVRVKGVLAFAEDRLTRSVFNMSGRRRLSFEADGTWQGPLSLYLVVIGVGIDRDQVLPALEGMRVEDASRSYVPPSPVTRHDKGCDAECREEAARLAGLLEQDDLFDAVPRDAKPACAPNVVRFRFTGAGAYGIPPSQLCVKFGVNLDAVNRSILRAVNNGVSTGGTAGSDSGALAAGGGKAGATAALVTPSSVGSYPRVFLTSQEGVRMGGDEGERVGECFVLRYAVGGGDSGGGGKGVSLSDAWPMIRDRARGIMKTELGHIHFCNCFS